jgi:hypothetical protein
MSFWDGTQWVADTPGRAAASPRPSRARHVLEAVAEGGMIAVLGIGLIAGTTFAAKGGHVNNHNGSSAAITVPDGVFGGTTTATVNSDGSATTAYASCDQGGMTVYAQYVNLDATGHATFRLGPTPLWSSGAASCKAQAGTWGNNGRWQSLASTSFNVSG